MFRWVLVISFVACIALTRTVFAYDCMPPSVEDSYSSYSDYIFSAKVLTSGEPKGKDFNAKTKYVVEIIDVYKGDLKGEAVVFRETYWGDIFRVGEEYLVFADLDGNDIIVPVCSRTTFLQHDFTEKYIETLKSIVGKKVEKGLSNEP